MLVEVNVTILTQTPINHVPLTEFLWGVLYDYNNATIQANRIERVLPRIMTVVGPVLTAIIERGIEDHNALMA